MVVIDPEHRVAEPQLDETPAGVNWLMVLLAFAILVGSIVLAIVGGAGTPIPGF